jgi:exodeoxyribonuclease VII large subunit
MGLFGCDGMSGLQHPGRGRAGVSSGEGDGAARARVWGVASLVQAVGDTLATRYGTVVVRGEISNFTRAASGHGYFVLKDEAGQASLRCAMFKRALSQLDFAVGEGQLVEARGQLSVYEARGELQMVVEGLQRAGAGALYEQFLRLKARLEVLGLFDAERKRAIGPFPRQIGIVTSLGAAALRDVVTTLRRRAPHVQAVIFPCLVQGSEAPEQIVGALAHAAQFKANTPDGVLDTLLLCRGGGSLEDLWAFNDERVVHAVAESPVPIICGVGHETDITLADLAADLRAPTPTAAAEMVAMAQAQALGEVDALALGMQRRLRHTLDVQAQRLDHLGMRLSRPAQMVASQRQRLQALQASMASASQRQLLLTRHRLSPFAEGLLRASAQHQLRQGQRLDGLASRLQALDPQRVLERGYAWLGDAQGHPLVSAAQVQPGQDLQVRMADGELSVDVRSVQRSGKA